MRKTIAVGQLRPGMHVHKLLGSWMDHPFWRSSFRIEDSATISTIRDSGIAEVIIDISLGVDVEVEPTAEPGAAGEPTAVAVAETADAAPAAPAIVAAEEESGRVALESEILRARRICLDSKETVSAMLREARMGRSIDTEAALPLVEEIANSVLRNAGALISVARLKTADDYTYMHSVAVCALMIALGRQLGLDEATVREAGMAGLMHDMGKALMPLEVLNKPGKLTEDEFALIKTHPEAGHKLLLDSGMRSEGVLDVALHHHEKADGSGYPHGLAGEGIAILARMGAVCDVYDAITSNRPYKPGWDPAESIRRMTSWKGHYDTAVLKAFIKSVGIYPLGALVRLASDKLGVVVEQHPETLLKPVVQAFYSAKSRSQILMHRVDLSAPDCQDRIVNVESPTQWGFKNLERLWMPF